LDRCVAIQHLYNKAHSKHSLEIKVSFGK
jgi:hypothetical protein